MGSNTIIWIVLILLLGAMWYMSSRSRKQQAKATEFRNNLKAGDEVMTHSGMLGTVVDVEGDNITIESMPGGSQTRWIRAAIAKLIEPSTAVDDADDDEDADDEYDDEDIEVQDDLSSLDEPHDDGDDEDGKDQK